MKVLFDAECLYGYPNGGIPVYAFELLKALSELDGGIEFEAFAPMMRPFSERRIQRLVERERLPIAIRDIALPVRVAKWSAALSRLFMKGTPSKPDLIHAVNCVPPGYSGFENAPLVATIHDLAFLRNPGKNYVPRTKGIDFRTVLKAAKRAARIIAVSEFTKREIIELLRIEPEKIAVSVEGMQWPHGARVPDDEALAMAKSHGLESGRYFLSVGTISPRKGFDTLLDAFAKFRLRNQGWKLAICGRPGWACEDIVERMRREDGVEWICDAGTNQLMALYQQAKAFFLLSRYEGFGIPVLEAMSLGCPVCYADGSSLGEIAGDCGLRVAPGDADAAACAMARFAEDSGFRAEDALKSLKRSKSFTWRKAAEETCKCYCDALNEHD